MYWWHLNNVKKEELIYKIYKCQKLKPQKNDWIYQLKGDLKELNISLEDSDLTYISKERFNTYIKEKVENIVRSMLEKKKKSHSKSKGLPAFSTRPEPYLFSKKI